MSNPGAKPNPSPSVRAIVRWGLTAENRRKLAKHDDVLIRKLRAAGYKDETITAAITLCQERHS